ncbi:hypothetical protein N7447_007496 [Penicillium robsamsonii]|uniref:uncharacterized protein n=1 Tax=Penicillium robsamsonii TaxID=1792511 RepID=UPI002546C95C|nr:uncharacterized protein N7447_007496 [Penicillium robsamsonii]KAJ5817488.1 hypothetical protein N7447_007496 [Penicillium robsamsonii]
MSVGSMERSFQAAQLYMDIDLFDLDRTLDKDQKYKFIKHIEPGGDITPPGSSKKYWLPGNFEIHDRGSKIHNNDGANVMDRDYLGHITLHIAAESGTEVVVSIFLEEGAEVSAFVVEEDNTPRNYAESNGHEAIIRLLDEAAIQRVKMSLKMLYIDVVLCGCSIIFIRLDPVEVRTASLGAYLRQTLHTNEVLIIKEHRTKAKVKRYGK